MKMNTFPIYPDTSGALIAPVRRGNPAVLSLRRYGETGVSEKVQLEADRKWFPIVVARRPRLKAIVDGVVARVCAVDPAMTDGALVQIAGLIWLVAVLIADWPHVSLLSLAIPLALVGAGQSMLFAGLFRSVLADVCGS
jgi:hypothetical protein